MLLLPAISGQERLKPDRSNVAAYYILETMLLLNLCWYVFSFVGVWIGAGFILSAIGKFSKKLRLSPFAFSFIFLGLLTSIPEFSVGMQAVVDHDADIFVGNLLGGVVILFLFVIPALAVVGNGISLKHEFDSKTLLTTFVVILAPALYSLDRRVTNFEGAMLIILYCLLLYLVQFKMGLFDKDRIELFSEKIFVLADIFKIAGGVFLIVIASDLIVHKTIFFAEFFNISIFYLSLIIVSLGTNLPELSLAVRSVLSGKKDVAMGDYMGSAAANTLLFGVFTIMHNGEVITASNFALTFIFIGMALILFYYFFITKKFVSRTNGVLLIFLYFLFVYLEFTG